ncbi:MAG: glucosaminidase domain-containing protein, partial [Bacteroidia bacterium]|nr:glucosaminidase domain-containing protein [Bacteroidia bacterium]
MKIRLTIILLSLSFLMLAQPAEHKMTAVQYIEKFKDDAIKEMLAHGVPASITLSQGMLESGNGNSDLAVYANNHFGIKCHKGWEGPSYIKDDDAKDECFRKYPSVLESYADHSQFLRSRSRYAFL